MKTRESQPDHRENSTAWPQPEENEIYSYPFAEGTLLIALSAQEGIQKRLSK